MITKTQRGRRQDAFKEEVLCTLQTSESAAHVGLESPWGWARAYVGKKAETDDMNQPKRYSRSIFLPLVPLIRTPSHPIAQHRNTLRKLVYFRSLGSRRKLFAPSKVALSTRTRLWDAASHDTAELKLCQELK